MAAVSLNSNLAALSGERALNASSAELSSNLESLSSGKRINHASDDAAGLAVSSTLNAVARIHTQAARNVNDGISFLNVADGATSALKDILFRLRELSTQSSNGTFSNAQRQSIDKESQALQVEYGRILDTTRFNGIRVFGSGDVVVQAGVGVDAALLVNLSSGGHTTASTTTDSGTYQAKQSFAAGALPSGIVVGDLNGDGKSDLVTAGGDWGNDVSFRVLLGNGNGTFQDRQTNNLPHITLDPAVADLDGDGKLDLLMPSSSNGELVLYLGSGDGTFAEGGWINLGANAGPAEVVDLDGDHKSDLVVVDYADSKVFVLLGNGDGDFKAPRSYTAGTHPNFVAVADLNGDGKSDVTTVDDAGTASVLLGNANGTFQAKRTYWVGANSNWVAVSDLNGDGSPDLVATSWGEDRASVLFGNANGTFKARQYVDTGPQPDRAQLVDLNGDGKSDLVATNMSDSTVSLLLGNGNGTFQARSVFGTGLTPLNVAVADFNGDGVKDLVTTDYGSNSVSVLLGNGTTVTTTTTIAQSLQPITGVSLATQQSALLAQGQIDGYLDTVNKVSGTIGTALSRFQIAAQVASSVADVSQAAEARITDADVAADSAALVRSRILQQAASSVLAQANQQPALALTLLRE